jgi:hypothetical protein
MSLMHTPNVVNHKRLPCLITSLTDESPSCSLKASRRNLPFLRVFSQPHIQVISYAASCRYTICKGAYWPVTNRLQSIQNVPPSKARFMHLYSQQSQCIISFLAPPIRSVSICTLTYHRSHTCHSATICRRHQQLRPSVRSKVDTFSQD